MGNRGVKRDVVMPEGKLLAWLEPQVGGDVTASILGMTIGENGCGQALNRPPATVRCASEEAAKGWVTMEARFIGVDVQWIPPPDRHDASP